MQLLREIAGGPESLIQNRLYLLINFTIIVCDISTIRLIITYISCIQFSWSSRVIDSELKKLKSSGELSSAEYKILYVNTAVTPRFYSFIKTHKPNNPIRPIVSFIDSPTYQTAEFLKKNFVPTNWRCTSKIEKQCWSERTPRKCYNTQWSYASILWCPQSFY